jgi:quercetin dioxygenase-like cupin family protein
MFAFERRLQGCEQIEASRMDKASATRLPRFERRLCRRNEILGGGSEGGRSPPPSQVVKIPVRERAQFSPDKMLMIALATSDRTQLDLYCVAPGQSQNAHTHDDQDKIYYVLEGAGRFSLGDDEERLTAGEALVARAGVRHGLVNDGSVPLLVLVVVAPPPPHGPGARR